MKRLVLTFVDYDRIIILKDLRTMDENLMA